MSDIFISYASPDRDKARALAGVLDAKGWSVWWDRTIPPGKEFDEVIEAALDSAKCVVVLWSKSSITSSWVKTEAADAMRRKVLVPALIDQVKIPLEFRRLHAADLSRWQDLGSQQDVATRQQLEALFQSISTLVAPDGATPTLPTPGAGERREREKLESAASARVTGPQGEPGVGKRKFTIIAVAVAGVIAVGATLALYKAHVDQIALQQAAKEQAAREKAAREQAAKEQAVREQAAREQAAKEQAAREKAAREQAAKEQAARERAAREQAAKEQAARGTATGTTKPAATNWQQEKMMECNAKAGDMKGDDRNAFMKTCLQAPAGTTGKCNDGTYTSATSRVGGACAGHGGVKDWYGDAAVAAPAATEQAGATQPKSKMQICNEKTKGMSKADADKARSECMKS